VSERKLEEEYFHKLDEEAKAKLRVELEAKSAEEARAARKALHAGKCGKCGGTMHGKAFRGIEIDVCEDCGAVLLDPGELEKVADHDRGSFVGHFLGAFGVK
jgi:hypothetical protein